VHKALLIKDLKCIYISFKWSDLEVIKKMTFDEKARKRRFFKLQIRKSGSPVSIAPWNQPTRGNINSLKKYYFISEN